MYKVVYLDAVEKDCKNLDRAVCKRILDKIEGTLAHNPKGLGKPLTGEYKGLWSYRIGDYRVIYRIAEKEILIIVARVGHRRKVYKRK